LPVAAYGPETKALTKKYTNNLRIMQRAMEWAMLGVSLRDKICNEEIRRITKVVDIIERVAELKWQWVGHVARLSVDRWVSKLVH